jgi:hypothetical protein
MSIQIPKSIKPVASKLASAVIKYKAQSLDSLPVELQLDFSEKCDHECFYQDADRYIGDVYREAVLDGRIEVNMW